jgi:hypothetical protein
MEISLTSSVLGAVLALVVWSLVIWIWMYATRIPAMQKAGVDPESAKHPGSLDALPSGVRAVADNYNHLMEQPTIFYALAFFTVLLHHDMGLTVTLAWIYVALRVVHSLIQATGSRVFFRFLVFSLSTLVLIIWAGHELWAAI